MHLRLNDGTRNLAFEMSGSIKIVQGRMVQALLIRATACDLLNQQAEFLKVSAVQGDIQAGVATYRAS